MPSDLAAKAAIFLKMHQGPKILVLPNAWDAASARIFEEAGFEALGTTSAGIAASLGYPDGEAASRAEMLDVVRRIVRAVAIPVTADVEGGYGPSVEDAEATARGVLEAGAAGLNFEDKHGAGLLDTDLQAERIRAIRRVSEAAGVPLVINARTDVYLLPVGPADNWFGETVRRANLYREAGADCLFVPGVRDAGTIGKLTRAIRGPVNILALAGVPPAAELERLGVARVSSGSGPMRAAMSLTRRVAEELKGSGTYTTITEGVITHQQVNRLMGV